MPYRQIIHWHTRSGTNGWSFLIAASALICTILIVFWLAVGAYGP